jgi:elongation factor Tu
MAGTLPSTAALGKPHLTVGLLGHLEHGKTTLATALAARSALRGAGPMPTYEAIALKGGAAAYGRTGHHWVTVRTAAVRLETAWRRYTLLDTPGHPDFVKSVINATAQMDAAVLVVSAVIGAQAQTREHLLAARQMGVAPLIVFINRLDQMSDPELLELLDLELRELLIRCGFPGDDLPILRGSAERALASPPDTEPWEPIDHLLAALDELPTPAERDEEGPLLMPVAYCYFDPQPQGLRPYAWGKVERGRLRVGEAERLRVSAAPGKVFVEGPLEVVGAGGAQACAAVGAGELVRFCVRGFDHQHPEQVRRGDVIATPGSVQRTGVIEVDLEVLTPQQGGRHTPFSTGYMPQFFFRTAQVTGTVTLPGRLAEVRPGERARVAVSFAPGLGVVVQPGQPFLVRASSRTVALGNVVRALGPVG